MHTTSTWYGSSRYFTHRRVQIEDGFSVYKKLSMVERESRLQRSENVRQKKKQRKEKKLRRSQTLEPEVQPQDNPGGPASGIKRPALDPPEDPRLEPDPSGTQLDTLMEESSGSAQPSRGTKRDADEAGVAVGPMDDETAITNLLLSHRKGFLGALHFMLDFKNLQKFYLFVRSNLTLTLKHLAIMTTFPESPWTPKWSKQRDVKSAKLFRQWVSGSQVPGRRTRR